MSVSTVKYASWLFAFFAIVFKVIRCRDCGTYFTGYHNGRFCDRARYLRRIATYGRTNQRRGRMPSPKGRLSGPSGLA